ncbi:bestrophin-like domain [Aminobacter sp. Piv2-1]|uniref:bestrophin-like domain n=1 Tax=Aminobacter sp. Piv2-1 TaxID=3031122 RepID=UPI003098A231
MEILYGFGFLLLFSAAAIGGVALRVRLHEDHLSQANMDALRLVTGLLVTFAALVLSLQLSTAKQAFDAANKHRSLYAARLARLDQCLRNLGTEAEPARRILRQYSAAVIASTWTKEKAPVVEGMPDVRNMAASGEDPGLNALMNEVGLIVDALAPADAVRANMAARCRSDYTMVQESRWAVIEDATGVARGSFVGIISFWLALVFLSFGLQIPRRVLGAVVLSIGVMAVTSVMFVIIDLHIPYGGMFGITSSAMRGALADMAR